MYLTQTYISPPKVATQLPKPNKDLSDVGHEGAQGGQDLGLLPQRECPKIVRVIIEHNKIVFVAGMADNG